MEKLVKKDKTGNCIYKMDQDKRRAWCILNNETCEPACPGVFGKKTGTIRIELNALAGMKSSG